MIVMIQNNTSVLPDNKAKGLSQTQGKDFGFMVKAKTKD